MPGEIRAENCLPGMVLPRPLSLPLTWPFLFSQPHGHTGQRWGSQYPQCWARHHAPHSDGRGLADRGHQPAGGCGLAAVSVCVCASAGDVNAASQGWTRCRAAARIFTNPPEKSPVSFLLSSFQHLLSAYLGTREGKESLRASESSGGSR